ncbi:MAG: DEAD/DEAH box helicase, partial [Acidimicrobiia bacterium]|nr:DEAD/DEAH box helicase [Acidimicrobiia bacterium]
MTNPSAVLDDFVARLSFTPDKFQIDAFAALVAGESVVVAAPTSAGKTLVAEAAVALAVAANRRAFYTTPIKALSNQKFADFSELYGPDQVGLLTGDNSINGQAPVIVMTTEVLRNMIYARSRDLSGLGVVVLDEVHYLQDSARGPVWEEIIIHLPEGIPVVGLSATVANAAQFTDWVATRRGTTRLVQENTRPVPLSGQYL